MTFKLGLTGSIGMGKSTTARMFVEEGCALWDADEAVHRLYAKGGAAVALISESFPQAVTVDGVNRTKLREIIARDPDALGTIEAIVHPLVAQDRARFLDQSKKDITVLDIPLLFETGTGAQMDAVVCVTTSPDEQEKRVFSRGAMTAAQFRQIREKQMPNAEKEALSDYVISTDTLEHARAQVQSVVADIRKKLSHA